MIIKLTQQGRSWCAVWERHGQTQMLVSEDRSRCVRAILESLSEPAQSVSQALADCAEASHDAR
mgnify:CR=1 FL=1